jgi:uncharacterized repeat protein (TIGR03803 family)/parallel beta-helix repeat protein
MKSIQLALVAGVVAVILLSSQISFAQYQITSCPYTASVKGGTYVVMNQLFVRSGDCIDVTAPGVTVLLNTQTVASNEGYAINIYPAAKHVKILGPGTVYNTLLDEGDSALIEGLTIGQLSYSEGLVLEGVKDSVVKNNWAIGNPGVWLDNTNSTAVEGNTVTNSGGDGYSPVGILLTGSSRNVISNNNTSQNGIGIQIGYTSDSGPWYSCATQAPSVGNVITNNVSNRNSTYPDGGITPMIGIWLTCGASRTIVAHNAALDNFNYDAYDGNEHCKHTTWKDNKVKNVYPSCILGQPSQETVLYKFQSGNDGSNPISGLVLDKEGSLYGTVPDGGVGCEGVGCGYVFKLTRSEHGWTKSVLYEFTGMSGDGWGPSSGLIFDRVGNLYGETGGGGLADSGTVYKLSFNSNGTLTETVLFSFGGGVQGAGPYGGLIFDQTGNLYGVAGGGLGDPNECNGSPGCGVVFELTPERNGNWSGRLLHSFKPNSDDGIDPDGGITFDTQGNLYGATYVGGAHDRGTVYKLAAHHNGAWSETVIHRFANDKNGRGPLGGVVMDKVGNLFGTTWAAGFSGPGTVFELSPTSGDWKFTLVHAFNGSRDVGDSRAGLTLDSEGNLYGTEAGPGFNGAPLVGGVFKLTPQAGREWKETVLYHFGGGPDGSYPVDSLVLDHKGNLFGTTIAGGAGFCTGNDGCGTVFEVQNKSK